MVPIGEMARSLGVAVVTLRRWERSGKLKPALRTAGGHRRYGELAGTAAAGKTVLYARVSCSDRKSDLERQKARLLAHAAKNGWEYCELIADLGSGLNFRKRSLLRLLDMLLRGKVARLVIGNRDRLLRFGAELVFRLCAVMRVEVVIVDAPGQSSFEADLARDVLEIITVFPAKLYGARSAKRRRDEAVPAC